MNLIKDLFSGPTNTHWELARVLTALQSVALIAYQGYAIAMGQAFEPVTFATGAGAILAAGGLGISLKDKARPKALRDGEEVAG